MYMKPTTPQSIGQVLDGTFRLTASSFRHVWILALLAGLASYAATVYQFTRGDTLAQSMMAQQDGIYYTLYFGGILLSTLFFAALYLRVNEIAGGGSGREAVMQTAGRRLPRLILLAILWVLAVGVGLVLLVIPGLIFLVSFMLSVPILLLEDKGAIESLKLSHRLVWGHWWRTTAILTVATIIVMVMYFVIGFIAAAIAPLLAGGEDFMAGMISILIVLAVLGVLVSPFFASLVLNIYWDLKLRKEGGDLAVRAQAV